MNPWNNWTGAKTPYELGQRIIIVAIIIFIVYKLVKK